MEIYDQQNLLPISFRAVIGESKNLVKSMPEKAEQLEGLFDAWLVETEAQIPSTKGKRKR